VPRTPDSAAARVFQNPSGMRAAFRAVGELLSADGYQVTLLIVGSAARDMRLPGNWMNHEVAKQ
jgi:hypothetical protein